MRHFNPLATALTVIVLALMAGVGVYRITFETDIVATLPERDPVIAAARGGVYAAIRRTAMNDDLERARACAERMYENDRASRALGIEIEINGGQHV